MSVENDFTHDVVYGQVAWHIIGFLVSYNVQSREWIHIITLEINTLRPTTCYFLKDSKMPVH
jgi:hypothetical protein